MIEVVKSYWEDKPLYFVLIIGFVLRLLAAIFSEGYAMHDDHFLLVEAAGSWLDGHNFDRWLNEGIPGQIPTGHSFFYVGIQYLIFLFLEGIGVTEPKSQMYFVRIIHGVYSLLVIYYGYKITEKLSTQKVAAYAGLILASFWVIPFFSVHNLVEAVCVPPLLAATWMLFKHENEYKWYHFVFAGLLLACSVAIRIQTIMFFGGFGLVLLVRKEIVGAVILGLTFAIGYSATQSFDLLNWGYPFAEVGEYIRYNLANSTTYFNMPWFNYILIVLGFFVPPVSIFLTLGYFKNWKKNLLIFLPPLCFFIFHSYFPNKQERFIYPFLPYMLILGLAGWEEVKQNEFWQKRKKLIRGSWIFFIVINTIVLSVFVLNYQKRARVESMIYLSEQEDFVNVIIENSNRNDGIQAPRFYLQKWDGIQTITPSTDYNAFYILYENMTIENRPNYVVFFEIERLEERVKNFEENIAKLELVTVIEPSFYDALLYKMNSVNRNEPCHIYKIKK